MLSQQSAELAPGDSESNKLDFLTWSYRSQLDVLRFFLWDPFLLKAYKSTEDENEESSSQGRVPVHSVGSHVLLYRGNLLSRDHGSTRRASLPLRGIDRNHACDGSLFRSHGLGYTGDHMIQYASQNHYSTHDEERGRN